MHLGLRGLAALVFSAIIGLAVATKAQAAEDWPTRPVRLILTLGAGSGTDIGARLLADRLAQRWGQPVIVDNRPGGDGLVAINAFVTAHDDHVLLCTPSSSFTAHPFLHDNLPYKPDDLVPIARISNTLIAISVPASMNVASFGDLIALARAEPGKLDWAGVTGAHEFVFSGWLKQMDINMVEVPYRNPVDAANDLAQDRVQVFSSALAIVRPQIEAGKIKLLAMANTVRAPSEPDVPTLREAGYPSLTLDGLVGLFGPPGMPIELRERITADIRAVADSTVADRLALTGQIMNIGGPEEFAKSVDEQRAEVAAFAAELGIKPLAGN
ncbi:MAG: tripartite tricarboxylate transporter substrate binding protein [Xanthobacteraceae bacterium]|jgi:tripartite-type tricarboxylate transporter receptor subunit TctC